jgi:hypothetical protein
MFVSPHKLWWSELANCSGMLCTWTPNSNIGKRREPPSSLSPNRCLQSLSMLPSESLRRLLLQYSLAYRFFGRTHSSSLVTPCVWSSYEICFYFVCPPLNSLLYRFKAKQSVVPVFYPCINKKFILFDLQVPFADERYVPLRLATFRWQSAHIFPSAQRPWMLWNTKYRDCLFPRSLAPMVRKIFLPLSWSLTHFLAYHYPFGCQRLRPWNAAYNSCLLTLRDLRNGCIRQSRHWGLTSFVEADLHIFDVAMAETSKFLFSISEA